MLRMEAKIDRVEVVHSGPELVAVYAQLRAGCEAAGHALAQKAHTADRWIAATAIRLGIPLVSNDGIFRARRASSSRRSRPAERPNADFACTRLVPALASSAVTLASSAVMARVWANKKVPL